MGAVRTGIALAEGAIDALSHPDHAFARAREAAEGIGEIVWAGLNPAPETPLNVDIGPHRRFVGIGSSLQDFKLVKNAFGGTVNDVVLTVVAGALRSFLISRGVRTEGMEMRALVPVSVRAEDEHGAGGNRIVVMRGPLPVYIADPVQRLRFVSNAMDGLKESKQALGAEVIAGVQNFAPPTILAQASRLNFSTRLFNLLVTNVPGPQFPLYVLGREMLEAYPVAFLPQHHALAIAIMSYNGQMNFGLLGDFDALPDIDCDRREHRRGTGDAGVARPRERYYDCLIFLSERSPTTPLLAASVTQRELRVLRHLLRRPRRREDHLGLDRPHIVQFAHELLDLLGHLRADRTTWRGQREGDVHVPIIDRDTVNQAQLDEVQAKLRVDHVRQSVHHVIDGGGGHAPSLAG